MVSDAERKECPSAKVLNPSSNRCVSKSGAIGKAVLKNQSEKAMLERMPSDVMKNVFLNHLQNKNIVRLAQSSRALRNVTKEKLAERQKEHARRKRVLEDFRAQLDALCKIHDGWPWIEEFWGSNDYDFSFSQYAPHIAHGPGHYDPAIDRKMVRRYKKLGADARTDLANRADLKSWNVWLKIRPRVEVKVGVRIHETSRGDSYALIETMEITGMAPDSESEFLHIFDEVRSHYILKNELKYAY